MWRFWIDTEFNGYKGDLISMALVGEDGKEWYEELECPEPNEWVASNVIPRLFKEKVTYSEMQKSLTEFLKPYDGIIITADWPEDIQHFCSLLITGPGKRISTPPLIMEVRRDLAASGSFMPHNALWDARALRLYELGQD